MTYVKIEEEAMHEEFLYLKEILNIKNSISLENLGINVLIKYWIVEEKLDNKINNLSKAKNEYILKYNIDKNIGVEELKSIINYFNDKKIKKNIYLNTIKNCKNLKNKIKDNNGEYLIKEITSKEIKLNGLFSFENSTYNSLKRLSISDYLLESLKRDSSNKNNKDLLCEKLEKIKELEKRIIFNFNLNKNKVKCLEDVFKFLKIDKENFNELKEDYNYLLEKLGVKELSKGHSVFTSLVMIYTAIYNYNQEDNHSYWPQVLNVNDYSITDVNYLMKSFKSNIKKLNVSNIDRCYLEKTNISEIFSQIYLPQSSLFKLYNEIYKYYFKNSMSNMIYDSYDFLDEKGYSLDKSSYFFVEKENLIKDSFIKLTEFFENYLEADDKDVDFKGFPSRFSEAFINWRKKDKKDIDTSSDIFNISKPTISINRLNNTINLQLPKQRNKDYSFYKSGWSVDLDGKEIFIDGSIIKNSNGIYELLDESLKLNYFKKIIVKYLYNDKIKYKWEYINNKEFITFDSSNNLFYKEEIDRDKLTIGFKATELRSEHIIREDDIDGWEEYKFYFIDISETVEENLCLINEKDNDKIFINIRDFPNYKKRDYSIIFDNSNIRYNLSNDIFLYKNLPNIELICPNIKSEDISVKMISSTSKNLKKYFQIKKYNLNNLIITLEDNIEKNIVNILEIKYKGKIVIKEKFIYLDEIKMINDFEMDYSNLNYNNKKLKIIKNDCFKLEAFDMSCLIENKESYYEIIPFKNSEINFIINISGNKVPVTKIIKPIDLDIIGLEKDEFKIDQVLEMTSDEFKSKQIRIEIKNNDYRYDYLSYELAVQNYNKKEIFEIKENKDLFFSEKSSFKLSNLKDRIINKNEFMIILRVKDEKYNILFEKTIFIIKEKYEIYDIEKKDHGGFIELSWCEKNNDKENRILKLSSITNPWKSPLEFELEANESNILIEKNKLINGFYKITLMSKKDEDLSLFSNISSEKYMFTENITEEIIEIDTCKEIEKEDLIYKEVILKYIKKNNSKKIIKYHINENSIEKVITTILQLKNLIDTNLEDEVNYFIKDSFQLISMIKLNNSIEGVLQNIYKLKDKIKPRDYSFIITLILSSYDSLNLTEKELSLVLEDNYVDALCSINNNNKFLPENLKNQSINLTDSEILGISKNQKEIIRKLRKEVEIIYNFWTWITDFKNKKVLYNMSLESAFKKYELENNITTYRVAGYRIDELLKGIKCKKKTNILSDKLENIDFQIEEEKYREINDFLNTIPGAYKELYLYPFIAVVGRLHSYEKYKLILMQYFSDKWSLFNRNRVYYKLMII